MVLALLIYELSVRRELGRLLAAAAAVGWLVNASVQASYEQTMMDLPAASVPHGAGGVSQLPEPSHARASLCFGAVACAALLLSNRPWSSRFCPGSSS